ncbi:MAG: diguanylate cyclase, partial [Synechococcaceae cyanobacterium ELA182]
MQQVEPAAPAAPEPALKIIVIDDDPTGSQTVHGCPLLLRWDAASLAQALRQPSPLLFLLANTRALVDEAERELARQRRNGGPLTLAYLDLDRFKSVNDRFGHAEGDRVLVKNQPNQADNG